MKTLISILVIFALCSCDDVDNQKPIELPEVDETTQYVESLLTNANKNIDFDMVIAELSSKAFVLEKRYWSSNGGWREDEGDGLVGFVCNGDTCYSYWWEYYYGVKGMRVMHCNELTYTFDKQDDALYLVVENTFAERTQISQVVDYKDDTIIFIGELPFPAKDQCLWIGSFDADIQAEWDAILAEQEKEE